jgi:CPA1 family monovalent cation:H+ antiporter
MGIFIENMNITGECMSVIDGLVLTPMAAQSPLINVLVGLLPIFIIAAGVGIFVAKIGRFPYTIALLLAGFGVSVVLSSIGHPTVVEDISLTHDLILFVLLPPLLFEGAATTEFEQLRRNLWPVLALAVAGLLLSVTLLGIIGREVFGFSLLVSLLFAAMILPTDPVSVLALFEELGAPDRLSVIVEGESLLNDGVGVVLFSAFLMYVRNGTPTAELFTPVGLVQLAVDVAVVSLGGLLVGFVTGYAVYSVMVNLDEHMTEIVLTFILVYGSFLVAEHYLNVSGVIATVVAGLFIGNRGAEYAMSPQTKISIFNSLETVAFLVNTFIFIMIGVTTSLNQLIEHASVIAIAILLVLAVRAVSVYSLTALVNRVIEPDIPYSYQHVIVWGGLHASIPIALVLGLRDQSLPLEQLRAMVFGVAAFSLVVQGLSMESLLDYLGISTRSESEKLYELLVGRARAVDRALDAAERLNQGGDIPTAVYDDFTAEYNREKEELNEAISKLLQEQPELRYEQRLSGERRILRREKSALMDARRRGLISNYISEHLLEEVDLKLDRVRAGDSTLGGEEEGYEEFWRSQAAEFGLFDDDEGPKTNDE